jgi:site-specific recombinase XerD
MTKVSIRKYPTGKKVFIVTQGTEPHRVRRVLGEKKFHAETYAAKLNLRAVNERLGLTPSAKELVECMNKYLDGVKERKAPRTFIRYKEYLTHLRAFLKEKFPDVELVGDVQPLHLEEFGTWRLKQKRAAKTVQSELEAISTFFKWCEKMGNVTANPAKNVNKPKPYKKKPHAFSEAELKSIFRSAGPYELFYRTLYFTGFRLAEVYAMRVKDVDLAHNRILYHNLKAKRDEDVEINKTYHPYLVKLLEGNKPEDRLFELSGKGTTKFNKMRCDFHKLLDKLQIPQGTLHDFKNSFVTHLLDAGVPPTVVQYLAHHKNLATTLGYYRGPSRAQISGAINKLPL